MKIQSKWAMLAILYVVLLAMFLPYFGWSTQLTAIMTDLSITNADAGLLTSVTALVGGITLPFGGLLGDRWGLKRVIVVGLVLGIAGQLAFAYASSLEFALLARALAGISVGLLIVGPYTLAVKWFRESRQTGFALGAAFTTDGVGTMFALYVFAIVLSAYGWRTGMAISAVFLIAVLAVVVIFLKDPPATAEDEPLSDASARSVLSSAAHVLKTRNVLVAMVYLIGTWGLYALISSWMPTILIEGTGWSPELAGFYTAMYPLVGAITAIIFGLASDRIRHRRVLVIIAGVGVTLCMFGMSFAMFAQNYVLVAAILPILGLAGYTGAPVLIALAIDSAGAANTGAVNGTVQGAAFLVGGFVYPYAIGTVRDFTGTATGGFFGVSAATLVLCLLAALFVRDVRPVMPASSGNTVDPQRTVQ